MTDDKCGDTSIDDLFNGMMDALESLLLSHACARINVTNSSYIEGLEIAINACVQET